MTKVNNNVKWLAGISLCITPLAFLGVNVPLILTGIWLPTLFGIILWRDNEAPILMIVVLLQWLEIFTGVFYSNIRGIPLEVMFGGPEIGTAIYLGSVALVVAALGARVAITGTGGRATGSFFGEANTISIRSLWWVFIAAWFISTLALEISALTPQIRQLAIGLSGLDLAAYFLLACVVILQKRDYRYLVLATVIELGGGIGGFFADFKQALVVLFIAVVSTMLRVTVGRVFIAAGVVFLAILLGIIWSVVKMDYRDYLSGYTGAQIVVRPWEDRVEYLADRVTSIDSYDIAKGMEKLANRISYVEYFGYAIRYVPHYKPHENGKLLWEAVEHVIKPRLFFPNKKALEDDTVKTARYTGIQFHSVRYTSIGLGYFAEAYIDYGKIGMFVPIFFVGVMWGLIYRFFTTRLPLVYGSALAIPVLINSAQVGLGFNKVFGGTLVSFVVMAMLGISALPRIRKRLYRDSDTSATSTSASLWTR